MFGVTYVYRHIGSSGAKKYMKENISQMKRKKMSKDLQTGLVIGIIVLVVWVLVVGGLWWLVLWSFEFPILFAWKQVFGVIVLSMLLGNSSIKSSKYVSKKMKGKK